MLKIASDILPTNGLTYIAFRIAFCETWERFVLCLQLESRPDDVIGFLDEVPFLKEVPVHVQLDLLADTWARHTARQLHESTLVDEAVVYAVAEFSANLAQRHPKIVHDFLQNGPLPAKVVADQRFVSTLRDLHLKLSDEGDFLLISQFLDIEPDVAEPLKADFGMQPERTEALFDVLGRWNVMPGVAERAAGLLSHSEQQRLEMHLRRVALAKSV